MPLVVNQTSNFFEGVNPMTSNPIVQTEPTHSEHGQDLAEFFQEDNRKYSTMRAMSFIALIAAIVFGTISIIEHDSDGKYITTAFLVAAFAPKAIQRYAERP
jgi:hypothetical protein